jgi:hypothetical protein
VFTKKAGRILSLGLVLFIYACRYLPTIAEIRLQSPRLCEGLEAAVVSFFNIIREAAAGQLLYR